MRRGNGGRHLPIVVAQEEDAIEAGTPRRRERFIAVPRRSVHPDAVCFRAQHDAIVAEDDGVALGEPEARHGALARARRSNKEPP
jgi:hypothetical protein